MSTLVNLEQIRAAKATACAGNIVKARNSSNDGDQLSGYHSLIITNGLLATLAYSADKGTKIQEHSIIARALLSHIADLQQQDLFPLLEKSLFPPYAQDNFDIIGAIDVIARYASPDILAMMTNECMAFLNYLKRFVRAAQKS